MVFTRYNLSTDGWIIYDNLSTTNSTAIFTFSDSLSNLPSRNDMSVYSPSITYFNEWLSRLQGDGDIHFRYHGNDHDPPFLTHSTYRDRELIFQIGEHTIMAYTDGPLRPAHNARELTLTLSPHQPYYAGDEFIVGLETYNGIRLCLDPHYMRFVRWDDDNSRWAHVPTEGDISAARVFIEHINIETFFRNWRPPTLEDVMRRTWRSKREQQIGMANRRVATAIQSIISAEQHLENQRNELANARATLSEWGHMTLDRFMDSVNIYRDLLENLGNEVTINDGAISVVLNAFELEGIELGPYRLEYEIAISRIRVHMHDDCGTSESGYWHPHVDNSGNICWGGEIGQGFYNAALGNPFEALFLTTRFLKESYNAEGAYCRLNQWNGNPNWYCVDCDDYHPNNSSCPNECAECGNYVDWNNHSFCQTHFLCYNPDQAERCVRCQQEFNRLEEEKNRIKEDIKKAKKKKSKKKTTKKKAKKKVSKRRSRRSVAAEAAE